MMIDSGKGLNMFLNKRPDTYEVEIVVEKKHSSDKIQFIQKIDDVITLHGYDGGTSRFILVYMIAFVTVSSLQCSL